MVILKFQAKSFKKMEDPTSRESERTKYVCYAKAKTIFKDTCKFNDNMSLASCSYLANIYMIEYEQNKVTKANSEIRKNLGLYRWVTCKQLPRFK